MTQRELEDLRAIAGRELGHKETRTVTSHSRTSSSGVGHGVPSTSDVGIGLASATSGPTEGWFGPDDVDRSSSTQSEFSSQGESQSQSDFESEAESFSETTVPMFVPIPVKELGSETEWSREKLSKVAEMLEQQQQRHCFVKLDGVATRPMLVPEVKARLRREASLLAYKQAIHERHGALPAAEADRLIAEREQQFLEQAHAHHQSSDTGGAGWERAPKVPVRRRRPNPQS